MKERIHLFLVWFHSTFCWNTVTISVKMVNFQESIKSNIIGLEMSLLCNSILRGKTIWKKNYLWFCKHILFFSSKSGELQQLKALNSFLILIAGDWEKAFLSFFREKTNFKKHVLEIEEIFKKKIFFSFFLFNFYDIHQSQSTYICSF